MDAGYRRRLRGAAGAASLALDLLDDGTTTQGHIPHRRRAGRLGAQITTASSLDLSFVRLRALTRQPAAVAEIFADVVLNPSFPQDMVELAKKRRLAQIGQEKAEPVPRAAHRAAAALRRGARVRQAAHGLGIRADGLVADARRTGGVASRLVPARKTRR